VADMVWLILIFRVADVVFAVADIVLMWPIWLWPIWSHPFAFYDAHDHEHDHGACQRTANKPLSHRATLSQPPSIDCLACVDRGIRGSRP